MRKHGDYIVFPHRGKPPACPEGYEKEVGDDFVCVRILESCEFRDIIIKKVSCCDGHVVRWKCKKTGKSVTRSVCKSCQIK